MSEEDGARRAASATACGTRVVRAIGAVHDLVAAVPSTRLRPLGFDDVTPALLAMLVAIEAGGSSLASLRAGGGRSKQAVSQLVEELRRRGYAELVAGPRDRRSKVVVPTSRGMALRDGGMEALRRLSADVAAVLGDDCPVVAEALERLATALGEAVRQP